MKILGNFNTTLDQEKLTNKSFLIKTYPMFLISFKNIIIYFSFIFILLLFIYYQQKIFWNLYGTIANIIYLILLGFWIIYQSWFLYYYIRHFKVIYTEKDKELLKKQDEKYDKTLKFSFLLLFINIFTSILSCFIIYFTNIIETNFLDLSIFLFLNFSLIFLQWSIIKNALINLEMNFTIVDWDLMKVDQVTQKGFFKINYNGATFDLISSIDWDSSWIFRSWLQYWRVDIATMGNTPNITIKYVKKPSFIADLILRAKNLKFE